MPQDATLQSPTVKPQADTDETTSSQRSVRQWQKRIQTAKARFDKDFTRMRHNMKFAAGLQWHDQKDLMEDRYVANVTLRAINQKVATLYAKDPKAIAKRRDRMDFSVWNGDMESVQMAFMQAQQAVMAGMPVPLEVNALLLDYQHGKQWEELVDKVGKTLEVLYQYECDSQEIAFKTNMKHLVRRVATCGVGYVKLGIEREYDPGYECLSAASSDYVPVQAKKAQRILQRLAEGDLQPDDPEMETLRILMASMGIEAQQDSVKIQESLTFDFRPPTSVIVDPRCRNLRGFVGAHWIVEEDILPLEFVNAMFETNIEITSGDSGDGAKAYTEQGMEDTQAMVKPDEFDGIPVVPLVCLWHIYDRDTRSEFYIVDGYKEYVCPPEPVSPRLRSFWPIYALTFNDVEVDNSTACGCSIYPPSDVDLMRPAQKEINRCRQTLREHRKANQPNYFADEGIFSEQDKDRLNNANPNELIFIQGAAAQKANGDITKLIMPVPKLAIDPAVYEIEPLMSDIKDTAGVQEANLGDAKANVTATVGNIAEQSRVTMSSSNVDDIDDCLLWCAESGSEILLREFSGETVVRVVGSGAVWPDPQQMEDFCDELFLQHQAASSGRPNKALDVANAQAIGPLLIQAGANPTAMVEQFVKVLDPQIDVTKFFPLPLPMPTGSPTAGPPGGAGGGQSDAPAGQPAQVNAPNPMAQQQAA